MGLHPDPEARASLAMLVLGAVMAASVAPSTAQEPAGAGGDQDARAIVQKADEVRFPTQGFEVGVLIRNFEGKEATDAREYKVLSKGNDNTIVMTLQPASERGQILL